MALIFLAVVYGSAGAIIRYLSFSFALFQQIYLRTLIALILGVFFFRNNIDYRKIWQISASEWLLFITRSFASYILATALWVAAAPITKLSSMAFIDALPLTAVISFILGMEKATLRKIFWVAVSFSGVLILSVKDFSNLGSFGAGELLVLISGFFFAFRNISRRWHSKLLNDGEISQLMNVMGVVMLFVFSTIFGEKLVIPSLNMFLIFVLFLGGFIMFANVYITNYGFARVSAVLGNNILNMEPVFAILFGFILYSEIATVKELIGGVIIILSVIKMNQEERNSAHPARGTLK